MSKYYQKNYCTECGCTCVCERDCGGDIKLCTNKKAIENKCVHCCECYKDMLIKNNDVRKNCLAKGLRKLAYKVRFVVMKKFNLS